MTQTEIWQLREIAEMNVVESRLNIDPLQATREFLTFVREKLSSQKP